MKPRNSLGLLLGVGLCAVISCSSDQKSSTSNGGSAGVTGSGGSGGTAGGVATGGTNTGGTAGNGTSGAGTAGAGGVVITPPTCTPMPTNGDACDQQGGACTSGPTLCVCYTGKWICADTSTCDATQPANRDPCVGSEDLVCQYDTTACACVAPNAQQDAAWRCIPIVVGGAGGAGGAGAGGAGGTAGQGTAGAAQGGTAGRNQGPGGRPGQGGRGP